MQPRCLLQVYTPEEELLRLREIAEALEQEQYRSMLELQIGQRHVDGLSEKVVELQAQLRIADADAAAMKQEIGACRNVAAILEWQKQDSLREAALLRDEIVALRTKIEERDVERAAAAEKLDLERRRTQELEEVAQAVRAKHCAAQEAERVWANENAVLQDQLQKSAGGSGAAGAGAARGACAAGRRRVRVAAAAARGHGGGGRAGRAAGGGGADAAAAAGAARGDGAAGRCAGGEAGGADAAPAPVGAHAGRSGAERASRPGPRDAPPQVSRLAHARTAHTCTAERHPAPAFHFPFCILLIARELG